MSDASVTMRDPGSESLHRVVLGGCGFCGSPDGESVCEGVGDWFFGSAFGPSEYRRCADCGSLWQAYPPAPESLPVAYASYYTHDEGDDGVFTSGARGMLRRRFAAMRYGDRPTLADALGGRLFAAASADAAQIEAAMRFLPRAPARVLDYGCGSGRFLARLRGFGYDVEGLEFDPVAVERVRAEGIACHTPDEADDLDWDGRFDAITLSHVIEHVHDPRALLGRLGRWLKPGGTLFVECPSADAEGLAVFGRYWRGLEAPRHIAIPSPEGLDRALAEAGFAVTRRIVRAGVRAWMWADSLAVVPQAEREGVQAAMQAASPETPRNAEFITFAARKGTA